MRDGARYRPGFTNDPRHLVLVNLRALIRKHVVLSHELVLFHVVDLEHISLREIVHPTSDTIGQRCTEVTLAGRETRGLMWIGGMVCGRQGLRRKFSGRNELRTVYKS